MAKKLSPLELAVEKAGGQSALARLAGVTQPTVWVWLRDKKPLPAECVLKVEAETGISRHDLRPDIYPVLCSNCTKRQRVCREIGRC
jgi:DNA-binding transcriptional regulator YdaS (Cro superfamily)